MNNKKKVIAIIVIIAIIASFALIFILNNNKNTNSTSTFNLDQQTIEQLNILNEKLDEYYIQNWDQNEFLSSYSYLVKSDGTEVTLQDLSETLGYETPESLKDVSIHFVKPKSLKPYLQDKILEEDEEILTVYSALPVENGMYISSKFDEGGFVSNEDYKTFVESNSWYHGDIKTPEKDSQQYNNIIKAVVDADSMLQDGNVKHIACDDKYAVVVISSKDDPAYIKQYALQQNEDKTYKIIVDELEMVNSKIFINYAYTDFDLAMLPLYEISEYKNISSNQQSAITTLLEAGEITENDQLTYSCGAGNFIYLEFNTNKKLLLFLNENGQMDIYEVDNFKTALSQMLKLQQNPPAFILNFE